MNWALRRSRKDGGIVFARECKHDKGQMEWYILSTGKTGVASIPDMKRNSSFVMALNDADNKMVEEGFNAS